MNVANMLRSLLPLVVICLLVVGVDSRGGRAATSGCRRSTRRRRSSWPPPARATGCSRPTGLPDDYLVTSARTDAGKAGEGDPVTLEIGYLTPSEEFAGFVVSDDPGADPVADVLDGAEEQGTSRSAARRWTRSTGRRRDGAVAGGRRGHRASSPGRRRTTNWGRSRRPWSPTRADPRGRDRRGRDDPVSNITT